MTVSIRLSITLFILIFETKDRSLVKPTGKCFDVTLTAEQLTRAYLTTMTSLGLRLSEAGGTSSRSHPPSFLSLS